MITTGLIVATFVFGALFGAALLFLCAVVYNVEDPRTLERPPRSWEER